VGKPREVKKLGKGCNFDIFFVGKLKELFSFCDVLLWVFCGFELNSSDFKNICDGN
jgi:hypothetical protein